MKIAVLGNGVIGVTSAWYLSQLGHDVTVIDRQHQVAEETSFANAGQISYGYSSPWAAPGIPTKALGWLFSKHAPLKIKPSLSPELLSWVSKMLVNCQATHYKNNKSRMLRLAMHSQQCLSELRNTLPLDYQGRQKGTLQLFRTPQQLKAIEKDLRLLEQSGTRHQMLDVAQCIKQEPGLLPVEDKIIGGLHLPEDETGDCYLFTQQLAQHAKRAGVQFMFNTHIQGLKHHGDTIYAVQTDQGDVEADAFVVALGSYSPELLRPLNLDLPIYPVKGYSLTLPIINPDFAPQSTIMDETYKVALTRFDDRIRVAGTAELAGFDHSLPDKRLATIKHVVQDLFPNGVDFEQAEYWTGFRPMTPDGTPIVGKTSFSNLYTNTGHGTLGWTMACGSAQLLADVVTQRQPVVTQHDEFNLSRYTH